MAIILEGCDGAGKSVLSKYLSLQFGWSVIVKHRRVFDRMLLSTSGVVVICEPCLETTCKGWQKNLDSKGPENWDSFAKIYFGYKGLKTDLPVIRYDWETDNYSELICQVDLATQNRMEKINET